MTKPRLDAVEEDGCCKKVAKLCSLAHHLFVVAEEAWQLGPPGEEHGQEDRPDGGRRRHCHDH
uniref:Uncharacterized protein n=1 Tax=Aegilops tauschii TaxID=37682 RepID=M8C7I2_AEGTA